MDQRVELLVGNGLAAKQEAPSKGLALEMLREAGYEVIDHGFTGASFRAPNRSLRTRLAAAPRYAARVFGADFAARLLGGETLIVLARPR